MRQLAIAVLFCSVSVAACTKAPGSSGSSGMSADDQVSATNGEATATNAATPGPSTPDPALHRDADQRPEAVASAADRAPAAERRLVRLRAGMELPVVLDTPVASDRSRSEDVVRGHLARPLVVDGRTALPAGTTVSGVITSAGRSGKVKGRAHVAMRFTTLVPKGDAERYAIATTPVSRVARTTRSRDAATIGLPAFGGAVVGGLVGGRKGAAIGGAAGGGAGTAVVLSTRGEEVRLGRGTVVRVRLAKPVTIRVPRV